MWDREVEFARSVQDHDARALAEHVHPGAVFVNGDALQQGADGVWRVTIDGGTPGPVPATEADVAKIKASLPTRCPI